MFRYMKKHSLLALLALCISIIESTAASVSAVFEKNMLDAIVQGDMDGFRNMLWYVVLIVVVAGFAYYLGAMTKNKFKNRFMEDLRNDLYDGIMRKGTGDFHGRDTAEYISMINNDVNTLASNFSSPIFSLAGTGVSVVLSLAVMTVYSPPLAGVAVLCSLLSFVVPKILTKYLKRSMAEKTVGEAALSVQLKEALNGYDVVSAFGVFQKMRLRFLEVNRALAEAFYQFSLQMFVSLYGFFGGGIMLFSQCVPLLRGCKPVIDRLLDIIDGREECFAWTKEPAFFHEIRIHDLCFRYREEIPVLTDLSLIIEKGEKLALTGESGWGLRRGQGKSVRRAEAEDCSGKGSHTGD